MEKELNIGNIETVNWIKHKMHSLISPRSKGTKMFQVADRKIEGVQGAENYRPKNWIRWNQQN